MLCLLLHDILAFRHTFDVNPSKGTVPSAVHCALGTVPLDVSEPASVREAFAFMRGKN